MAGYCVNVSLSPIPKLAVTCDQAVVSVSNPIAQSAIRVGEQGPAGPRGEVGPQGPKGEDGAGVESLIQLSDVQVFSPTQNDVLSYSQSINKWVNKPEQSILDGGNF